MAGAGILFYAPEHSTWAYSVMGAGALLGLAAVGLNMRNRIFRHGTNAVLYSLLVLFILVGLNDLASRHNWRFDVTAEGDHTLAPQTIRILEGLQEEIDLIAFYSEGHLDRARFEDLIDEYRYHTKLLRVSLMDPIQSPGEARRLEIVQDGTVVVQASAGEARLTSLDEEALTNALVKATRGRRKTVCFTIGHGEAALADGEPGGYGQVNQALARENYETKDLLLLRLQAVPVDCDVVVAAGPTTPFLPSEIESLLAWLEKGGRFMALKRDPKAPTGLDELLAAYGLRVNSDIVVDRLSRAIIGDEFVPVVAEYEKHPVTEAMLANRVASFFPVASSVEAAQASEEGVVAMVVARTGQDAWGETGEFVQYEEGKDTPGPVGMIAAASGPSMEPALQQEEGTGGPAGDPGEDETEPPKDDPAAPRERRLVLIGDSDFASNQYLHLSGNTDLFLNAVGWLAAEDDLLSIRPRRHRPQPVALTASTQGLLTLTTFVTPILSVVAGIGIWFRRKRL